MGRDQRAVPREDFWRHAVDFGAARLSWSRPSPQRGGCTVMQGRKDYTKQELENARAAIDQQLAAYRKLATAVDAAGDPEVQSALGAFEPRSEEHTSELQSRRDLVCRLLL